jgi:hypothetical protein
LSGTTLSYTDTSNNAQTATVANGDVLAGGNGTVSLSEGSNTVSIAKQSVGFDSIALGYTGLSTATVTAGTTLTVTGTSGNDAFTITSSSVAFDSTTVNYSGVSSVVVASGGGTDTFAVNSTASSEPLTVNSNVDGTSTTTVGNGQLNNIASKVTVNYGTLTVSDTGVSAGETGTMTNTKLTGLDLPGTSEIDYASLGTLNVNLGAHGNTFTVANTPSGATTNLSPGSASTGNSVGIQATTGSLTVTTASGAATPIVIGSVAPSVGGDLTGITGAVTITGHSGDSLKLYDSNDATSRTTTITSSAVTGDGLGATVNYSGVGTLGVFTGMTAGTVNVRSTASGTATTVTTGGGSNTITVGTTNPDTNSLNGALTITGDNNDTLTVDDSAGATAHASATLSGTTISSLAPTSITYGGITTLTVKLGASDGLTVSGTHAGTTTSITTPSSTDTVNVQAISSATTVTTGGGGNTVNVSSTAPTAGGNLDGIGALLTVNGTGTDVVNVDDSGSSAVRNPALSGSSITAGPAVIHYSGQTGVTLKLGSASDTVTVTGTSIASTITGGGGADTYNVSTGTGTLALDTGNGNDAVNVKATGAATTVTAGTGTDTVVVGSNAPSSGGVLDNITGALTITGGGATSLTLDDTGATTAKTATISSTSTTGLSSAAINYSNLANFTVNLGALGNTVTVSGTPATTVLNSGTGNDTVTLTDTTHATTITGGAGNDQVNVQKDSAAVTVNTGLGTDTVNVGSTAPTAGGTLSTIGFTLTINGDSFDTLNLDDTGDSSARTATFTSSAVTGLGNAGTIGYSGVGLVNLNLGTGTNTLGVSSTNGSATTTVNSKSGSDQISVQATGGATSVNDTKSGSSTTSFIVSSSAPTSGGIVNNIQGALTIGGASGGTDTLTVDDSGSTSAKTGSLSSTAITGLGMGSSGIAYSNIKTLTLKLGGLGAAGDNFTITGTSSFGSTSVQGGSGDDTINIQATGGPTSVNAGAGNNTVNVGSNAPLSGGVVAGIVGTLTVTGNPSKDVLNVDDSGDSSVLSVSPSPTSVTIGSATINYSSFSKVHIDLGSNGSYDIKPSANGITFNASPTAPTTVTVDVGASTVKIGNVTYSYTGFANVTLIGQTFGDGNDPLIINGTSAAESYTLSANTVSVGSTTIAYSAFASMSIFGGGGADSFIVNGDATPTTITDGTSSTPGSSSTVSFTVNNSNHLLTLVGGTGTSIFNVTGNSAALAINGTGGTNTFNVSGDSGSTTITGGTGALNNFNISGNSAQLTLTGKGSANNFSITGNSASLNATGGNGTDSFVVTRTTAPINLQAGNGTTTFHVTQPTQASVTVAGETTGNASLVFDGNFVPDVFTITSNQIQGSSFASLNYSALKALTVNGIGGADVFFVQGDTTPTTLNGANAADIFNIDSFSSSLTINTIFSSTVNLGSNQPLANSVLSSLNGTLTVNGAGGDQVNIDDSGDSNPQTVNLGATGFTLSPTTINYSNIGTLNLALGAGGNTLTVTGTAANTTTNVNTGSGNDSINVQAVGGTTNINTGGGNANPIIVGSTAPTLGGNLNNIKASLNLMGSGTDSVTLDDSGGTTPRTATVSATTVAITGLGTIGYSGISNLAANFGSGGNNIAVSSTNSTTQTSISNAGTGNDTILVVSDAGTTNIDTGGGTNTVNVRSTGGATTVTTGAAGTTTFNVGSLAPASGGVLDNIQGALTLGGGTGGSLTLDDTGSSAAKSGQLDAGVVTGLGMGSSGIVYTGIGTLAMNLGSGGDTLTIKNTDAATTVNSGSGNDTVTVQNDSSATSINTAGGNDTVNILAAHGSTTVNTGTGTDAVNIGSNAPAANGVLDNIVAAVSVTGSGAGTTLTLDDTGSAAVKTGNLTSSAITGLGMGAGVTYSAIGTLNLNLGSGGDTLTIASTSGSTTNNISAGAGNDTIYVQSTSGPSHTVINTGAGTNTVNVGDHDASGNTEPVASSTLNAISGPLDITGGGTTTVNLDDQASSTNKTGTISSTAVTGFSPATVTYAGLTTLNVWLGAGNKSISVTSTASGATTNVHDGSGTNTLVVGSLAPTTGGVLDGVAGNLNIFGSGSDAVTLDDSGNATAKTGTLSSTSLTGISAGSITYVGASSLTVDLGSAGDNLTITSTASTTPTTINAGSGNDTITLQSDSSATTINTGNGTDTVNIQKTGATTNVNTGNGTDTINIGSNAPASGGVLANINGIINVTGGSGGATSVNIDDTGRTTPSTGTISSSSTTGFSPAAINYSNLAGLTVSLGSGGNNVTVSSTPAPTTVNSGSGADTITLVSTANATTINSQAGNDNIYIRSTSAPTTVNTGAGTDSIIVGSLAPASNGVLNNIQGTLAINGDGNDTLTLDDTGSTTGKTGTLTSSALTGLGMGSGGATYSGIATFNLNLGSGNDNFIIASTNGSTTTNLNSDGGNDSLAIQTTSGVTNVNTGTGVNSVTVGSIAPSAPGIIDNIQGKLTLTGTGADSLTVDDTASNSNKTGTLTGTTITGLGMGPSGIIYSGFSTLAINLGAGSDTFNIAGTAGLPSPVTTTTSINMGAGDDILNVTAMGGPATVDGGTGNNTANINVNNFASSLTLIHFAQTNLTSGGLFSGSISTDGNLTGVINGDDSGTISAGTIDSIKVTSAHATSPNGQVFQASQGGVSRAIYAYPTGAGILPSTVSFKIFYDGISASVPQAAVRVTNTSATRFDLVLACASTATRFDLSRVDAVGTALARNISISGNLLNTVTAPESTYFGYAAGTAGGVSLPADNLVGVEARDNLATGVITAASIEGIACDTLGGTPVASLNGTLASGALAGGTAIHEGNDVFRVPVGEEGPVGLFVDTANDAHLNDIAFNLTDQAIDNRDVTALMNIVSSSSHNQYRVTLTQLDFLGNGGSLDTSEPVSGGVTATGSLGSLMLRSGLNMTNITVGSVIGNIDLFGGSLTGTFQSTGDIGRVLFTGGNPTGVTYINIQLPAGSKLVSYGNLISKVTVGTLGGVIAAQGNIGALVSGSRFGGITASSLASGSDILSLGTIYGDINISGTASGRIGAKVGILGNLIISNLAKNTAVVSGGNIGDATLGTSMNIGTFNGFVAAIGTVRNTGKTGTIFQSPLTSGDQTEINNIWNSAATFDTGGTLVGLNTLLTKLNSLAVSGGHLTGT